MTDIDPEIMEALKKLARAIVRQIAREPHVRFKGGKKKHQKKKTLRPPRRR